MPEMDGLTASRHIRATLPQQPWIVGLSANAFAESRAEAFAAGMNDYLTKPLKAETLMQALQRVPVVDPVISVEARESILDASAIQELANIVGSNALAEALDTYQEAAQERLQQMQVALATQDIKALKAYAHSLKGMIAFIGARRMVALCQELEQVCQSEVELEQVPSLMQRLEAEYEQVVVAIAQEQQRCR
jgi:HPt (histidine-containing phosphotransfer) domain-containing protein